MSEISMTLKSFQPAEAQDALKKRGLLPSGRVQAFVDSEVITQMEKLIPFDTGAMQKSMVNHSQPGTGRIRVVTPYAHYQSEHNPGPGNKPAEPMRGKHFFERTKAETKDDILRNAAEISGGRKG